MNRFALLIICITAYISSVQATTLTWRTTSFTQGGYAIGQVPPGSAITFLGHDVETTESGYFIIGFGRDLAASTSLRVVTEGKAKTYAIEISPRQYQIEKIDGLPPGKVNPRKPEVIERIRKDTGQIVAARAQRLKREDFLREFSWPLTGRISGVYGSQRVLNGIPKRPHFGVDIAAVTGTEVFSPNDGKVSLVHDDMFFSGGTLIIDHGYGLSSTFIHLHAIHVKHGQEIKKGDLIAEVGATGRATGPHLDWRINWYNQRLDPQMFVGEMKTAENKTSNTER